MNKTNQNLNNFSSQQAESHYFVMRKIGGPIEGTVFADLSSFSTKSSIMNNQSHPSKNAISVIKTRPVFNKDGLHFTPAFVSQWDYKNLSGKLKKILSDHKQKQEQLEQKDDLFLPMPAKVNNKCEICKVYVDDYLQHLDLPNHKHLLSKGIGNDLILDLCERFKHKTKKIFKQRSYHCQRISQNQITEEISNHKSQFQNSTFNLDPEVNGAVSVDFIVIQ